MKSRPQPFILETHPDGSLNIFVTPAYEQPSPLHIDLRLTARWLDSNPGAEDGIRVLCNHLNSYWPDLVEQEGRP